MSLILDALNRSRDDDSQVPGLATQHFAEPAEEGGEWRRYLPWAALLLALLVIGWLLLQPDTPPPMPSPPTVTTEVTVPAAADTPAPQPVPTTPEPLPQQLESPPSPPAEEPLRAPPPASLPAAESVTRSNPAVADLYRQSDPRPEVDSANAEQRTGSGQGAPAAGEQTSPVPAERSQEEPIDIEEMVLQAREEMENASLEEHSALFIAELSQQTKDNIPTIFYERHDYSGKAAQSSVVLNGKKLKVGGSPASGVKIEEILTDSVVLSYRGTQFRLRALNSWINL